MEQVVEYSDSSESKIIIQQQLNANSDHIAAMDKSLSVTKTHSCHVAAIESLNLHKSGSNRGSYDHSNGCLTIVAQKLDEKSPPEFCAVDKSLNLASSADSSDSGIAPNSISNGKSDGIVDQLSTSKRSNADSHDESKGLTNETLYLDAVSELDSISSSTSYGESSYVLNQCSTPKRLGANINSNDKSSGMLNQVDNGSDRDQNVAIVDFEPLTLSSAHSETDIILDSLKYLFEEEPLTADSDDDSFDSDSDEWITEEESSDDDESEESDEPVEIFGGFYFSDSYFNERLTNGFLNVTYYSDSDDDDYVDSMSGYEDMYGDDYENFELNDSIRAAILQNEIESNTCRYNYTSRSSGTTDKKCPICLAPFVDQEDVRALPCCHLFHTDCIDEWFKLKFLLCPNCKLNIKSAREYFEN